MIEGFDKLKGKDFYFPAYGIDSSYKITSVNEMTENDFWYGIVGCKLVGDKTENNFDYMVFTITKPNKLKTFQFECMVAGEPSMPGMNFDKESIKTLEGFLGNLTQYASLYKK